MTPGAIHITTQPQYLADRSAPDEQHYVFAYTITIHNKGNERVRLMSRRWVITDANGKIIEVEGSGVVGEQPSIAPGEDYTYTSGVSLETPVGVMEGSYTMTREDGSEFQAPIDAFRLALPNLIN
ncbi:Co2+/Mg2+ efflux protein ApaG [Oceanisphaera psychrotolerans]|jgi:ApaG protein|uniref:Protein ApaG n=1 Tax=Oceanisphaera psychrotolerans TaxID=1414654 RepID=A0A1J4QG58_9GAMM|nr:Co2+/Mg2+ efflux protein ApaG [Oceanisphaera psychrotolerans]OIN13560.1 Co2+/Mg2+ efflux protein ApaG [Oceanisphaera psychrotolerans]